MFDPFAVGPAVTSASVSVATLVRAVRRDRRADSTAERSVLQGVTEVHLTFQEAATAVLYRLNYLSSIGLPPSLVGAAWTWPAVYRATRDLPAVLERLHLTFVAASTTGPTELLAPAEAVFTAIGAACDVFATRRQPGRALFSDRVDQAYERLGDYSLNLRKLLATGK